MSNNYLLEDNFDIRKEIYNRLGLEFGSLSSESGNDWILAEKSIKEDIKEAQRELSKDFISIESFIKKMDLSDNGFYDLIENNFKTNETITLNNQTYNSNNISTLRVLLLDNERIIKFNPEKKQREVVNNDLLFKIINDTMGNKDIFILLTDVRKKEGKVNLSPEILNKIVNSKEFKSSRVYDNLLNNHIENLSKDNLLQIKNIFEDKLTDKLKKFNKSNFKYCENVVNKINNYIISSIQNQSINNNIKLSN